MKVGDLVKNNRPYSAHKVGVIIKRIKRSSGARNKIFKVLWTHGKPGPAWDYDLLVISEDR